VQILLDTNVILRWVNPDDPHYSMLRAALDRLARIGDELCYSPQNIVEFWSVSTRPLAKNGLGLRVEEAGSRVQEIERKCFLLPDSDRIHELWKGLVLKHSVRGAQVHDARLVAAMMSHGVQRLLTFNGKDFRRYAIEVVEPQQVGG